MKDCIANETLELSVAAAASKATYVGAGSITVGWLLSNEFALVLGMLVAIGGFLVNLYYKRRAGERVEQLFKLRVDRIALGCRTDTDLAGLGEDE
ncbi:MULTISPECIES: holin [unclassified Variovorax]|uniref:holin n=1 Tax=unclassified Variovorax TaxID=663243 RepID=UPI0025776F82|nr:MULTISPECIES: holin [unclassified Variovorax]MDM0088826.1 holin [Variovorax sp. J22G40]MDM0146899.1 holin [Variovorax sp. J2P1-31]